MNEQWRRDRQNFLLVLTPTLPRLLREQTSAGCQKQLSDSAPLINSGAFLFARLRKFWLEWKKGSGISLLIAGGFFLIFIAGCELRPAFAKDLWKCTAYCNCKVCTDKTPADKGYGITASCRPARWGYIAANGLKFGTKVKIEGLGVFEVADRGSNKHFGTFKRPLKHLDIWFPTHKEAKQFGVQYYDVQIIR